MIFVLDNFLSEDAYADTKKQFVGKGTTPIMWHDAESIPITFKEYIGKLKSYFGLDGLVGIETWVHDNTKPDGWHYDKDEFLFNALGELKHPNLATVLYLKAGDVQGGNLLLNGMSIKPIENRLVCFSGDMKHCVEEFTGDRTALAVNFWNDTPIEYLNG
jgi:hypothetical protein